MGRPERAAERVLDQLRIKDPKDLRLLEEIAYERGAIVREKALKGAEARLTIVGRRGIITLSSTITHPQRRRFSIAHELGHLEMHPRVSSVSLCSKDDLDDWRTSEISSNREQEANAFAAALLMPQRFFEPMCREKEPSLEFIQELASRLDTSLTATALRYTQFCDDAIAVVFSQNNIIRWFRGSKEFRELGAFVDVKTRLDPDSTAFAVYRGGGSSRQKRVRLSSWLAEGNYKQNPTIVEQSWAMPNYDGVLTLLWLDDDISDNDYYWST